MEITFLLFHENEKMQLNEKHDLPPKKVVLDFLQISKGLNQNNHCPVNLTKPYLTTFQ